MKETKQLIENVIKFIIIPQYPEIVTFEIREIFRNKFYVLMDTSECYGHKKMWEITKEVQTLFSMLNIKSDNPFDVMTPEIQSYFRCDDKGYVYANDYEIVTIS